MRKGELAELRTELAETRLAFKHAETLIQNAAGLVSQRDTLIAQYARIAKLESWIKKASPLIRAVGLDPIPERQEMALELWKSIPVNPFS